jgi:uncharacterized protein YprB with RNaseH-like and TPR domain
MSDWSNLSDRLKRLGVQWGISQPMKQNAGKAKPLEELVPGRNLKTIYGEIFSLNHTYPEDLRHGHLPLKPLTAHDWLAQWAKASSTPDLKSLVFLDTETTGLSGGTGTMPFMIGAGRFIENQFVVEQFFVRNPAEETAQLAALSEFVEGVEGIVTYNGKSFDMPIINTRYIMQRLSNPFTAAAHFDLLHFTRRIWKSRLGQCNLGNIETQVLGFQREQADIPGHLVPDFYREYLFTGDATHMPGIFYHNEVDVLSLSALFSWLAAILEDPSDDRFTEPGDLISVGRVLEILEREPLADQVYSSARLQQLEETDRQKSLLLRARLQKRTGNLQEASKLWQEAAALGAIEALIELAKYYEHHLRHYEDALRFTDQALSICSDAPMTDSLLHRKARLEAKIIKTSSFDDH